MNKPGGTFQPRSLRGGKPGCSSASAMSWTRKEKKNASSCIQWKKKNKSLQSSVLFIITVLWKITDLLKEIFYLAQISFNNISKTKKLPSISKGQSFCFSLVFFFSVSKSSSFRDILKLLVVCDEQGL